MIATTVLVCALVRLVVTLWASANNTIQGTRSLHSIVRAAHEFQKGDRSNFKIKHKEILFDARAAQLGPHILGSDHSIVVVSFARLNDTEQCALTTAYIR